MLCRLVQRTASTQLTCFGPTVPRLHISRASAAEDVLRKPYLETFTRSPRVRNNLLCTSSSAEAETTTAEGSAAQEPLLITAMDIRVGQIQIIDVHPEADGLYVEEVDVGEEEPRTICSGLVKYVPKGELEDRLVVVLCNLKPRNMRGIKSNGMLLCASDAAHENVEPLIPPQGCVVGERIFCGDNGADQPDPESPNKVQKKKLWEAVQPHLKTSDARIAEYQGIPLMTSAGAITTATLGSGNIS